MGMMMQLRSQFVRRANRTALIALRWAKRGQAIWRHRHDAELLASFGDSMLADIGLTRADLRNVAEPKWSDPMLLRCRRYERRPSRRGAFLAVAGRVAVGTGLPGPAEASRRLAGTALLT